MTDMGPIGVFDSGVGGLTVVKTLQEQLPNEKFIYFGDTAHIPYGNKSEQQLFSYARNIISFFISRKVKAVIVACGTHSSVTLPVLSKQYPVPLLGVVKAGSRAAVCSSQNGLIGVIATQATVDRLAYTKEIKISNADFNIFETACPRLVPLVEKGELDSKEAREAVKEYVGPLMEKGIDTLIMGCTHYPFLTPVIKEFVGKKVFILDPSYETIEELKNIFAQQDLFNKSGNEQVSEFCVSGNDDSFYKVGNRLIGNIIKEVHRVDLD